VNREDFIYKTLVSYLNELFSEFIFYIAYQNRKADFKKYGTVYNMSRITTKEKKLYFDKDNPKEQQERLNRYLIQIDLYSNVDDLLSYADTIISNLKSDRTIYYFEKNGLFLKSISTVRNLPKKYKNKWQYRRIFDIEIECVDIDVFAVDYITSVDIQKEP